ncbi:MAG: tetratricopeptide repeat protein [Planctomycetes bacterium]|nr:tetratricopeptide repeat protein [Planctomycetota bacterium]
MSGGLPGKRALVSFGAWIAVALFAACGDTTPPVATPSALATAPERIPAPDLTYVADAPLVEAVKAAAARLEREPQGRDAWLAYAMLLAAHDWRVEAAAAFARLEPLEPGEFRWPYMQGVLLATWNVPAALAATERALVLDSNYAPAHVTRGRLLLDFMRLDDARASLKRAIELDGRLLDAWLALGQLELQAGATAAAETALRRALAIDSQHPEVNGALATICFGRGQKEEAERFARTARLQARKIFLADPRAAIDSPPVTARDHTDAAIARIQVNRGDEAKALLEKAIAIDPSYAPAWDNLALVQIGRSEMVAAEKSLRASLAVTATAKTEALLAKVLRGRKLIDEAIAHQQRALELDGDNPELLRDLARLFVEARRHGDAATVWEQVIRIDKSDASARRECGKALRALATEERKALRPELLAQTLRRAVTALPTATDFARELAFLLATCDDDAVRDAGAALKLAEAAASGHDDDPALQDTLAAAQAASGQFEAAVATSTRAVALVRAAGNTERIERYQVRLDLYRRAAALRVPLSVTE